MADNKPKPAANSLALQAVVAIQRPGKNGGKNETVAPRSLFVAKDQAEYDYLVKNRYAVKPSKTKVAQNDQPGAASAEAAAPAIAASGDGPAADVVSDKAGGKD